MQFTLKHNDPALPPSIDQPINYQSINHTQLSICPSIYLLTCCPSPYKSTCRGYTRTSRGIILSNDDVAQKMPICVGLSGRSQNVLKSVRNCCQRVLETRPESSQNELGAPILETHCPEKLRIVVWTPKMEAKGASGRPKWRPRGPTGATMPTRWAQGTPKGSSKGAKREPRRSLIGTKLAEKNYEKNKLIFFVLGCDFG